jgi:hypothetical protein
MGVTPTRLPPVHKPAVALGRTCSRAALVETQQAVGAAMIGNRHPPLLTPLHHWPVAAGEDRVHASAQNERFGGRLDSVRVGALVT